MAGKQVRRDFPPRCSGTAQATPTEEPKLEADKDTVDPNFPKYAPPAARDSWGNEEIEKARKIAAIRSLSLYKADHLESESTNGLEAEYYPDMDIESMEETKRMYEEVEQMKVLSASIGGYDPFDVLRAEKFAEQLLVDGIISECQEYDWVIEDVLEIFRTVGPRDEYNDSSRDRWVESDSDEKPSDYETASDGSLYEEVEVPYDPERHEEMREIYEKLQYWRIILDLTDSYVPAVAYWREKEDRLSKQLIAIAPKPKQAYEIRHVGSHVIIDLHIEGELNSIIKMDMGIVKVIIWGGNHSILSYSDLPPTIF